MKPGDTALKELNSEGTGSNATERTTMFISILS